MAPAAGWYNGLNFSGAGPVEFMGMRQGAEVERRGEGKVASRMQKKVRESCGLNGDLMLASDASLIDPRDKSANTPLIIRIAGKSLPQPTFLVECFGVEKRDQHRGNQQCWPALPDQGPTNCHHDNAGIERVPDYRIDSVPHQLCGVRRLGKWGEVSTERHRCGKRDDRANEHQSHSRHHHNGKPAAAKVYRQQCDRREQNALCGHPDSPALIKAMHAGTIHIISSGGRSPLRRLRVVYPRHVGLPSINTFVCSTERTHLRLHLLHQLECRAPLLTTGTSTDRAVHTNPGQDLIQRRRMSGVHGGNFQAVQSLSKAKSFWRRSQPRITSRSRLSSLSSTQTAFSREEWLATLFLLLRLRARHLSKHCRGTP